jgi:hypothetical protein
MEASNRSRRHVAAAAAAADESHALLPDLYPTATRY